MCDKQNNLEDVIIRKEDFEVQENLIREFKEVSAKYGYVYKDPILQNKASDKCLDISYCEGIHTRILFDSVKKFPDILTVNLGFLDLNVILGE